MERKVSNSSPLLLAIPNPETRRLLRIIIERRNGRIVEAASYQEALQFVQTQSLRGMIIVSTWAVANESPKIRGLLVESERMIPAIILVSSDDFRHFFVQYNDAQLYPFDTSKARDDYITTPFDPKQLLAQMWACGMIDDVPMDD